MKLWLHEHLTWTLNRPHHVSQEDIFSEDSTEQCADFVAEFRDMPPSTRLKAIRMMNQAPLQEEDEKVEEEEEQCDEEEVEEEQSSVSEQTQSPLIDDVYDLLYQAEY